MGSWTEHKTTGSAISKYEHRQTSALLLPWVPEDIFFLSTLMVRGEAALTRRKALRRKKRRFFFGVNVSVSIRKKNPLEPRVHCCVTFEI